ncbi:MAG TPA: SDR family oxidoreductase, partial [Polyangia bacterium]|nr:SDR family oxidoreductase [Polyangia bacterium]
VTGAGGTLGRRVLALLLEQAAGPIIATTRNPAALADFAARGVDVRAADFDAPSTLRAAFAGAERALLISTDSIATPGHRLAQHQRAIRALAEAGVRHVVYTSMPKPEGSAILIAPDHDGTEKALHASALDFTILRNNIYADMLLEVLPGALASGQLVDAKGDGATAYVWREDCARVAVAALADRAHGGRHVVDVSGPAAVTAREVATLAAEVSGRPLTHVAVSPAAYVDGLVAHGMPQPIAEIFASFDSAIARGEVAHVGDGVQRLTGQPPRSMRDFLAAHRQALLAKS